MNTLRVAVTVLALVPALVAPAGAAPAARLVEHSVVVVVGHGTAVFPPVPSISFQMDVFVVRLPNGSVTGYYRHGGPNGDVVEARCVRVVSGRALIGGVIVKSRFPSQIGMAANLVVDDRGSWGRPLGDRLISGIGPGADQCRISPDQILGPWDDVVRGDFAVVTVPSVQ